MSTIISLENSTSIILACSKRYQFYTYLYFDQNACVSFFLCPVVNMQRRAVVRRSFACELVTRGSGELRRWIISHGRSQTRHQTEKMKKTNVSFQTEYYKIPRIFYVCDACSHNKILVFSTVMLCQHVCNLLLLLLVNPLNSQLILCTSCHVS